MYIYKIDIPANGQCYIGQTTKSIQFRFGQHKNSNASSLIARAIQHWGNPIITQLHKASSKNELNRLETEEIKARRHKAHNEAQRKLCNKIHAQVAENKLLLVVGETK